MEVTDVGGEEEAPGETQQRMAKIAVQQRHGARPDAATKTVADDHRIAGAQALDERVELREIVAVIGIGHDYESSAGGVDSADQCAAVALVWDTHDSSTGLAREFW